MIDAKFSYQIGSEFAADLFDRLATPEVNVADAIADTLCTFAIVAKECRRDVARGLAVGLEEVFSRGTEHGQDDGKEYREYLAENDRLKKESCRKYEEKKARQQVEEAFDFAVYVAEVVAAPEHHQTANTLLGAIKDGPFAAHQKRIAAAINQDNPF